MNILTLSPTPVLRRILKAAAILCSGFLPLSLPAQEVITTDSIPAYQPLPREGSAAEARGEVNCEWWKNFSSPALDALIDKGMENNFNLKGAIKRIEASRQMLRSTYSSLYPTVGVNAGYNVEKGSGRQVKPYGHTSTASYFSLGAEMNWEIDVFGRVKAQAKADEAAINVSRLDYEAMMLTLQAEIAQDYFMLSMYGRQLEVANAQLADQQEVLRLVKVRYNSGLVAKLDVVQAQNTVNTTMLLIPSLEANIQTTKNALSTLCGLSAGQLEGILSQQSKSFTFPLPIAGNDAVALLEQRPDIAMARQQIEELAAKIGVAKKDYLPALSLTASIGTESHSFDGLFGKHSLTYSIAPQLSWTVFEGFARNANVAQAKASMEAAIEDYNMTVATAVEEVNNAMTNFSAAKREVQLYDDVIANSREMLSLAIERYNLGLADFSDVTSAQVSLLNYETSLINSRINSINSIITLYKALGGGLK